jgi:hypothetical protein
MDRPHLGQNRHGFLVGFENRGDALVEMFDAVLGRLSGLTMDQRVDRLEIHDSAGDRGGEGNEPKSKKDKPEFHVAWRLRVFQ